MTSLLTLLLIAGLGLWAIFLAMARSSLGLAMAFAATFVRLSFGRLPVVNLMGISLDILDVVTIVLLIAGILRLVWRPDERPDLRLPMLAFLAYALAEVAVISVSAVQFGEAAFQPSRIALQHLASIGYVASFRLTPKVLEGWFKAFALYATGIVVVFVLRLLGAIPLAPSVVETLSPGSYLQLRYIVNYQSIALAFLFLSLLVLRWSGRLSRVPGLPLVLAALLAIVVMVPQRMVWILFAVGLAYLAYAHTRKALVYVALLLAVGMVLTPVLVSAVGTGTLTGLGATISSAAIEPIANFNASTGGQRVEDWQLLIGKSIESGHIVFGEGYVPALTRYASGTWVSYGIHNLLVSKVIYGGLVLFGTLAFFWVVVLRRFMRSTDIELPHEYREILAIGALGIILFSMTSGPGFEMGFAVGACLSIVSHASAASLFASTPGSPSAPFAPGSPPAPLDVARGLR